MNQKFIDMLSEVEFNKCPECGKKLYKSKESGRPKSLAPDEGEDYLSCRSYNCNYKRPYKKGKL